MTANIKPRFEAHKLEGKATKQIATPTCKRDEKGKAILDKDQNKILLGGFDYKDVEVDAGWMIYFPNGSSIRVWTKEEMERQGFLQDSELVDMDSGDVTGVVSSGSLKSRSEQLETVTKSSKVHHTT